MKSKFQVGDLVRPKDPNYIEKIASLASQYTSRLQELEQARKQVRKELAKSAKELGVKVPDFDFACSGMDKTSIARMICERYGIEWDENQSVSHIGEKAVAQGMISAALGQNCFVPRNTEKNMPL